MPFVKLDCGILNSTLWFEREAREIFLTALLMAEPQEFTDPVPQINVRNLDYTGWEAPPGWYGFVPAAGIGIIARAKVEKEAGLTALEMLGKPEDTSRSQDFDGRRLIRMDGGYVVLNYMKYRDRDYTTAERSRRYRERKAAQASHRDVTKSHRDITQAEAEADIEVEKIKPIRRASRSVPEGFDSFWMFYPKRTSKQAALKAWAKLSPSADLLRAMLTALAWQVESADWLKDGGRFVPMASTWLNGRRWEDEPPSHPPRKLRVGDPGYYDRIGEA